MKKTIISLGLLVALSSITYSSVALENNLGNIEKEFELLEQKEKEKFKEEEQKARIAQQKYKNQVAMINTINERVVVLEANEKTAFFPQEQKKLLETYRKLEKELRVSSEKERKQLEEFNQLKNALGY